MDDEDNYCIAKSSLPESDVKPAYTLFSQTPANVPIRNILIQRMRSTDNQIYRIVDRIYLSSLGGAYNKPFLLQEGITHVLTVGLNLPMPYTDNFVYHTVSLHDSEYANLLNVLPSCLDIMRKIILENSYNKILVHCFAGISRSVSVIVAYLMKEFRMTYDQALRQVRFLRPEAFPNNGFVAQLRQYEQSLTDYFHEDIGCVEDCGMIQ